MGLASVSILKHTIVRKHRNWWVNPMSFIAEYHMVYVHNWIADLASAKRLKVLYILLMSRFLEHQRVTLCLLHHCLLHHSSLPHSQSGSCSGSIPDDYNLSGILTVSKPTSPARLVLCEAWQVSAWEEASAKWIPVWGGSCACEIEVLVGTCLREYVWLWVYAYIMCVYVCSIQHCEIYKHCHSNTFLPLKCVGAQWVIS